MSIHKICHSCVENFRHGNGENSPLHHAVSSGHQLCVAAILEEEEDRRTQRKGIRFTLSRVYSAVRGLPSAEEEPDLVNATNEIGATPLYIAASKGDFQMVKMLVTHPDIDVNIAMQDGATPLYIAACRGDVDVVRQLMTHPEVDVNAATQMGFTPVYFAAQEGHWEVVEQLMEHPLLDVNKPMPDGATPLYIAAQEGHWEAVRELLEHPHIDVNTAEECGATPLYIAAQEGHFQVVKHLLIDPSLDVNRTCGGAGGVQENRATALYIAVQEGCWEVVRQLSEHPHIDLDKPMQNGESGAVETPLDLAKRKGYKVIESTLSGEVDVGCLTSITGSLRNQPRIPYY
mmetsp:Transcript_25180/g.42156  ORF Transcript_25180/g.42156 Transcript_25180/m.42156 type:complete len:345 (+) Transcript_25180:368-1402(+)|eukprot:CAMPEP_0198218798 /NCGR_PEP_ID=MMETSP1445-20131203/71199_1 /TAXON_ID=36898 /ORGANISM="Pyramimonas sp., Strain CCMP2087" /LENGTH=344 /DNA_ID=CAMNT_0043895999 /DNA_START=264 /DNA_END=1298 /DNA_ORIENTATION=-